MVRSIFLLTAAFYAYALTACAAPMTHEQGMVENQIKVCKPGSSLAYAEDADKPLPVTWSIQHEGSCKYQ